MSIHMFSVSVEKTMDIFNDIKFEFSFAYVAMLTTYKLHSML